MSEQTSSTVPTRPKNTEKNTISNQKKNNSRAALILTVVEISVIAILSALSIWNVHELTTYDSYYELYYFFAITGGIFIVLLLIAYFRKWLGFQLISVILFLLWTTYSIGTIYSCRLLISAKKREAPYMNAEMYVMFEGKVYTWEGKTIVYDLPADWTDLQSRATIQNRDDSGIPTTELTSKGIDAGSMIFYQDGYKYILVEVVTGSLFEFIDPDNPPEETISTATTSLALGG